MILHGTEEEKLGDGRATSFQNLIIYHEGGVTKPLKTPITCNNDRVDTTEIPRSNNTSNLISTLLSHLKSQKFQMFPYQRGRVGHASERVTTSEVCKGELGNVPK